MPQPTRPQLAIYIAAAIAVLLIGARFLRSQDGAASGGGFGSTSVAVGEAAAGTGVGGASGGTGTAADGAPDGSLAGDTASDPALAVDGQLVVDVKGAVRRPGVYRMPANARAFDAVRRAGGVTRHADRVGVNLAARVVDGGEVIVPRRGAGGVGGAAAVGAGGASGAVAGGGAGAGGTAAAGSGSSPTAPLAIDLNTATAQELELLDGVGPALAANILAYREANGGISSIDELDEVSGIGEARLAAIRTQLGQ